MKLIFKCRILLLGIIPVMNSCSQQQIYKSKWQANDFSTLSYSQLQESMHFYDNKSKLQYNITNDNKKIYICIKEADEKFQMKIIHAGLQINIDTSGKDTHPVVIIYPIAGNGKSPMPLAIKPGIEKDNKTSQMMNQIVLEHKEMQLLGFKPPINGLVPLQNKYDISVGIDWDSSDNMYYKAIIPFSTFYKEELLQEDSSKIFNITFTVNALEMPGNKMGGPPAGNGGEMQGEGNMPPAGGNMQGDFGNGGPPPGGGNGMRPDNSFSEKNVIKIKIKMAVKNF